MVSVFKVCAATCVLVLVAVVLFLNSPEASFTVSELLYDECVDGWCLKTGPYPYGRFCRDYSTAGYSNNYDPRSTLTDESCTGGQAEGPDMVFELVLSDGDEIDFECRAYSWDVVLYMIGGLGVLDCNMVTECVAGSNVGGAGYRERISYVHSGPTTHFFLIVDGFESSDFGSFSCSWTHDGPDYCNPTIPVEQTSWGKVKEMYR